MSVLTTLAGGHYTLTAGAAAYRVKSLIDQQLQADFGRWLLGRAVADLAAARPLYTAAEYDAERAALRDDARQGLFDFKSARGAQALGTLPGLLFVLSHLIEGAGEGDVLGLVAACQEDVAELVKTIIQDSFPEALRAAGQKKNGPAGVSDAPDDPAYRQAVERYQSAVLADTFGLRPWEIARLTDRQIKDVYFHPRDEHGALVAPGRAPTAAEFGGRYEPAASLEDELKALADLNDTIHAQNRRGLTNYAEAVAQVEAKWADGTRQKQRAEWAAGQKAKATDGGHAT